MRELLTTLIFLFALTISCAGQKKEKELVRASLENYKSAILNDKGEEAVKYVDSRTVKYYSDILEYIKSADSTKVNSLSILDKILVFSIRHRTSKENILSFDGKKLLVHAIKIGMVVKSNVANSSIGKVTINSNFATGQLIANGKKTPLDFHFYKEEGQWRVDLTALFPTVLKAFQARADDSGQDENEYLFSLLEITTGRKPGPEIWETIR